MNRFISKIFISLICVAAASIPAYPDKPAAPVPADKSTADESKNADPEAELQQLKETLAKRNSRISQLKQELEIEKGNTAKLTKEVESLSNVISAAIPLAEKGAADIVDMNVNLADADIDGMERILGAFKVLSPYSGAFATQYDNVNKFLTIAKQYQDNSTFDTFPYSEKTAEEYADNTLETFDLADNFLSKAQVDSINNLYKKIYRYRDAVEAFGKLIGNLDNVLEINRDNKAADKLCITDRDDALAADENKALIAQINNYRYLAGLYDRYIGELEKSPRSRTESVRGEIAAMLAETEDAVNENESEEEEIDDTPDEPQSQEM